MKRERERWIEVREGEPESEYGEDEAEKDEAEKGRVSVLREMKVVDFPVVKLVVVCSIV